MPSTYVGVAGNIATPSLAPSAALPVDGDADQAASFGLQTVQDQIAFLLRAEQFQALQNLTTLSGPTAQFLDVASDAVGIIVMTGVSGTSHWLTSPDGKTWTVRSGSLSAFPVGVLWVPTLSLFVGVFGVISSNPSGCETSPDGITWTSRTAPAATAGGPATNSALAFGGGVLVAAQGASQVMSSPDGITWTARGGTPMTGNTVISVVWAGSQFIAVSTTSQAYTSPDGITWTSRGQAGSSATAGESLVYNPRSGAVTLVNAAGANFVTTTDGITWTNRGAFPGSAVARRLGYAFGRSVGVGVLSGIYYWLTSDDGITWTKGMPVNPQPASGVVSIREVANDRVFLGLASSPWGMVSMIAPYL